MVRPIRKLTKKMAAALQQMVPGRFYRTGDLDGVHRNTMLALVRHDYVSWAYMDMPGEWWPTQGWELKRTIR